MRCLAPGSRIELRRESGRAIRSDRIVAVAPDARVALPAGTTVIAGSGRWLMPGLVDMHVHTWRDDDLTMFVAAGVTTIRNRTHCPVTWFQAGSTPRP